MFSLSMFGSFRCSVFRCSVPFEVWSVDIQSFDVRSHSTFSLSMFSPIRGSVFRCSVLFDVRSFEVWSFDVQSFEVRSFEVRSFEVRSRFPCYILSNEKQKFCLILQRAVSPSSRRPNTGISVTPVGLLRLGIWLNYDLTLPAEIGRNFIAEDIFPVVIRERERERGRDGERERERERERGGRDRERERERKTFHFAEFHDHVHFRGHVQYMYS